jgi:hypothetical protein
MNAKVYQELTPYLARLRWRLRLRSGLNFLQHTFWIVCLVSALILLAGRFRPLEGIRTMALAPLGLWVTAALAILLLKPFSNMQVARKVDQELGLKERISTCLAFNSPKIDLTRRSFDAQLMEQMNIDALTTVRTVDPRHCFPTRFEWRRVTAGAILLMGAFLLAFLPNPMDLILAEQKAVAQTAREQAQKVEDLKKELEKAAELTPEEKEKLLQRLEELARQLQNNSGNREQALADLNRAEQAIREQLDPGAATRKAALEAIAARLQALAGLQKNERLGDLKSASEDLAKLAAQIGQMTQEQRDQLAQDLGQLAARAAQAGDSTLAQALAGLAQAAQTGDSSAAQQAAQAGQRALQQAQTNQSSQQALQRALAGVQSSRQAMAGTGGQNLAQGGQSGQNPGQGQQPGSGTQPGGGGGTQANTLPGGQRQGNFTGPNSSKPSAGEGTLDSQIYVPREKRPAGGNEVTVPGQDTGQGTEQTRQSQSPLPGTSNPSLIPYRSVYQSYLDTASQALDQNPIPADLKDFVREYFSNLEP